MSRKRSTTAISRAAAIALAAGLVAVPQADAQEAKTTDMTVVMGCNVQVKTSELGWVARKAVGGAEGVYNGGTDKYNMIRFSPKVTAPTEAEQGKQFDYVIDLGKVGAPDQLALASVRSADQMNVWIDLPKNATLDEVALEGGDADITYTYDKANNRIRFHKKGAEDVSRWTLNNETQWKKGGWATHREGNLFVVSFPKVTLKMTPTGQPGEEVAPYLDKTDPNKFDSKAFAQLYANASAVGVNANAFVRCGLGGEDSTPNNGTTTAAAQTDDFPAVKIVAAKKTEADTNTPTAKAPVTITKGSNLPDAKAQLNNVPANATAAWTTTHTEIGDNQPGAIKVTYSDGSTDEVKITVNVKRAETQADKYDPKAITEPKLVYYQGDQLPDAKDSVVNPDALPAGTTFEWKYPANKIGENLTGTVVITYPDGSKDEVTRPVAVRPKKTQADENDPQPITEPRLKWTLGDPDPDPRDRIKDFEKLPSGTTAAWTSARGKTGPNLTGIITVTYPDGSTDEVRLPVDVSAPYAPQAKLNPTVVTVGTTVADADAKAQIANADQAPEGTTFTWKTKPVTTEAGDVTGVVTVQVPNKDAVDVEVHYTVVSENDTTWRPQVTAEVQSVEKGTELTDDVAKALVTNLADAPTGATVAWKTKPETSKAGATTGVITITVGEGDDATSVERAVRYNVTETFAPEAKEGLTVEIGTEISDDSAAAAIANVPSAPYGTKYEWVTKPDTTKVGETTAVVKVSIPGENDTFVELPVVTVPYTVTSSFQPKKNDTPADVVYGTDTTNWGAEEAASQIQNGIEAPAGTTYDWITKPDTTKEGKQAGQIKVTVPGQTEAENKTFTVDVEINVTDAPVEVAPFVAVPAEGLEAQQGHLVKEIHAYESIANKDEAPEGTTFTWKEKPDTEQVGPHTGVVIVKVPGQDPQEVTINYTITERPVAPPVEQPAPNSADKLVFTTQDNQPLFTQNATLTFTAEGEKQTITLDADGAFDVPANIDKKQTVEVKFGENSQLYKIDLENGTYKRALTPGQTAGVVVGSLLSVGVLLASFIPAPGLKDAMTNLQKQLGVFNPQLAGLADQAAPIVGAVLGLIGLGTSIGLGVKNTSTKGATYRIYFDGKELQPRV